MGNGLKETVFSRGATHFNTTQAGAPAAKPGQKGEVKMTKLFDETRTVGITMREWDNRYNEAGLDWSRDFFEVGTLEYDEERDAYRVNDVAYCVECAEDWANATGDFSEDEVPEYIERQVFVEEV